MRIATGHQPLFSRFLVDLAFYPNGLQRMFDTEPMPCYELLYLQTGQEAQADAGPLLIEPLSTNASAAYRDWTARGQAIELQSSQDFSTVATHLRTLTMVQREQASPALFRYADPRLYAGLAPALRNDEVARLLGPQLILQGVAAGQPWRLEQQLDDANPPRSIDGPFRLTLRHLASLRTWRETLFLQPLADHYHRPLCLLSEWCHQLQAMGFDTEQSYIQGCRRLAELGLEHPIDPSHQEAVLACPAPWQNKLATLEAQLIDNTSALPEECLSE